MDRRLVGGDVTSNRVRETVVRASEGTDLEHVSIDRAALERFAGELADGDARVPDWRHPVMIDEREYGVDTVVDFFLVGNSLNFVFDDLADGRTFSTTYRNEAWHGSLAMWASLKRALESGIPMTDGRYLEELAFEEVAQIFEGDPPMPKLDARHEVLRHIGTRLDRRSERYLHEVVPDVSSLRLYDDGRGLVERLTEIVPEAYADSREYGGRTVYFDKKAQLAGGMLYGRFRDREGFDVVDIDDVTVFADYLIPALLRERGVIEYSSRLARAIDQGALIPEGSPEEVEIRLATVYVGEQLLAALRSRRDDSIHAFQLDQLLWQTARTMDLDHHFTDTVTY